MSMPAKVYILHENPEWLAPLQQALNVLGIPNEDWNLATGKVVINSVPPLGVFYNKMSASCYTRGNLHAKDLAAATLAWLEAKGRRVVNKRRALQLEMSKAEQQLELQKVGLSTPHTIVALSAAQAVKASRVFQNQAFILKPNQGGKGQGVSLFQSTAELEAYLSSIDWSALTVDGLALVQKYISPKNQQITRMEFIQGQLYYAVSVDTGGGFELCPADACEIDPNQPAKILPSFRLIDNFSIPEVAACEAFLAANDIEVAGIEFLEDEQGQRYFYDVNTNTNYNSKAEEEASGEWNGIEKVAQFLAEEWRKLN